MAEIDTSLFWHVILKINKFVFLLSFEPDPKRYRN